VFAGGFSIEAAEELGKMCAAGTIDLDDTPVLDLLTSLVDNNLLVSVELADGHVRLRMLSVVREFALESLFESGNMEVIRGIHSQFFMKLVREADPQLSGRDPVAWLDRLEAEHDNLRGALRWLMEREPVEAGQMAASLSLFWIYRGYLSEARRWLDLALELNIDAPTDIRLKLLNSFALVTRHQGDHAAARLASEESLTLSRAANDLPQIILSCHAVAGLETREGNFAAAKDLLEDALAISRELGDEKQIAFTLSFLGNLLLAEGKAAEARIPIEESLTISRRLDFRGNVIINLTNLGTADYYEGNVEGTSENFRRSLIMAREMGNKILVSCCIEGFAAVAAMRDKAEHAAFLAGAAAGLRELLGYEIEITEQRFREDYMSKLSAVLDADILAALIEQGKAMDPGELVDALLRELHVNGFDAFADSLEIIIESRKISTVIEDEFVMIDE
jgi:non-specific serine/threonine protein kinase